MHSRTLRLLGALLSAVVFSSCVARKSTATSSAGSSPELLVQASFSPATAKRPVGWIYAFNDAGGRKNSCVYIWSDSTWSLAEETSPGYFGDAIARGCIGVAGKEAMLPALDFPLNALDGWKDVYVAGDVEAKYKGRVIPSRS